MQRALVRHQSPHENIVVFAGNTTLFERARREIAGVRVIQLDPWLHECRNAQMSVGPRCCDPPVSSLQNSDDGKRAVQ